MCQRIVDLFISDFLEGFSLLTMWSRCIINFFIVYCCIEKNLKLYLVEILFNNLFL